MYIISLEILANLVVRIIGLLFTHIIHVMFVYIFVSLSCIKALLGQFLPENVVYYFVSPKCV